MKEVSDWEEKPVRDGVREVQRLLPKTDEVNDTTQKVIWGWKFPVTYKSRVYFLFDHSLNNCHAMSSFHEQ